MTIRNALGGLCALGVVLTACATTATGGGTERHTMDWVMSSTAARDIARDAPEAFAELARTVTAVSERRLDPVDGELTYAWALTQARAAEARTRLAEAERRRTEADTDTMRLTDEATRLEADVTHRLEARQAAERARTAASAPTTVPRAERAAVAADMLQEARLLVAAAELLGASAEARHPLEVQITAAALALGANARNGDVNTGFLAAGGAYTAAARLLRTTREGMPAQAHPTDATVLQQELSSTTGVNPHVDERGVVAVIHGLFDGVGLAATARSRVESLARVIQGHADARVSVEVWVGGPAQGPAEARARAQAQALTAALVHAGVPEARVQTQAMYRLPGGARSDDRVEAVLVLPSEP